MSEIKCPNCGRVFQVNEADYADILQQVRNEEFERELTTREKNLQQKLEAQEQQALKDAELQKQKEMNEKDQQISGLQEKIKAAEEQKNSALNQAESSKQLALADKDKEIERLHAQLANAANEKDLAVTKAVQDLREEKLNLENILQQERNSRVAHDQEVENAHKKELERKDEVIAQYRDFKARQSTKMIGESLEQHCLTEYNKVRMMAFPKAYFEKDNDVHTGSKGDFIFKESTDDGIEFISIMFEMKNEMETTATKHKNEDFFKELDKDRREKNCEYAVLVSLLEADNEYYNTGIVDVSYAYPKMYVIRPQFLIPMISLLRNAALNLVETRRQLEEMREQNIDITNFESNLTEFKTKFARNYELAHNNFNAAIEEIDKSIERLQKVKENLTKSDNNLRLANNKADDLTIKKLIRNNPTMRDKFIEAGANINN